MGRSSASTWTIASPVAEATLSKGVAALFRQDGGFVMQSEIEFADAGQLSGRFRISQLA